jgi:hypothetical protein
MNDNDEKTKIHAVLNHLGRRRSLRDLPGTQGGKVALIKTAGRRGLIVWRKGRNRYELTAAGWNELAGRQTLRGFVRSGRGAATAVAMLVAVWFSADASNLFRGGHSGAGPLPSAAGTAEPVAVPQPTLAMVLLPGVAVDLVASAAALSITAATIDPAVASATAKPPTAAGAPAVIKLANEVEAPKARPKRTAARRRKDDAGWALAYTEEARQVRPREYFGNGGGGFMFQFR